ncbi:MAG: cyclase family protein [Desulfosarcinaceae bacterium]
MKKGMVVSAVLAALWLVMGTGFAAGEDGGLWDAYNKILKKAKYVDLTHAFNPTIPVWPGFGNAKFKAGVAGQEIKGYCSLGEPFDYKKHGFISTAYELVTDQYGTQLDPPAHFYEYGVTISDLPATYSVRPLVVIDIHKKVGKDEGYHATLEDIKAWEAKHGRIPEGSVVAIRSDWSKKWNQPERFANAPFPGTKLDALKFLHLERKILFHGHEPLDTDTTPNMEGETWLLTHNYCQAEGMTNLDKVPEAGALILIGFAKPEGGTGGYARYIAVCPSDWKFGQSIEELPGAPLPKQPYPNKRDKNGVLRSMP